MKEIIAEKYSDSEDSTREIVRSYSELFVPGAVVALNGNLGSGKTLIVKEICRKFDIHDVDSPTFTIVNEYSGKLKVNHIDFYRIRKAEELIDIGIYDYINDRNSLTLIEWAEMYPNLLPAERIDISIMIIGEGRRQIKIESSK